MPMPKKTRNNCLNCGVELKRPTSKYCSNKCQANIRTKSYENDFLLGQNLSVSVNTLRQLLKKYFNNTCQSCMLDTWQSKQIPLEIHHYDGNHLNNTKENLTLFCPNCHALTDNYKYKNSKLNPSTRIYRHKTI